MTYPSPEVRALLAERFVLLKVDTSDPPAWARPVLRSVQLVWTPTLLVTVPGGGEVRRHVGFAPPRELLAELHTALGLSALRRGAFEEAHDRFTRAESLSHPGGVAPEAVFWQGIAAYRIEGRSKPVLRERWEALHTRYPDSGWWTRANVFPEEGG